MSKTMTRRDATLALAGGLAAVGAVAAATTPAQAEVQPFMSAALVDLNRALANLESATPDKGGHRVKAINLVRSAIGEVNAGMSFDNRR